MDHDGVQAEGTHSDKWEASTIQAKVHTAGQTAYDGKQDSEMCPQVFQEN